jgi:hypothetical protein
MSSAACAVVLPRVRPGWMLAEILVLQAPQ